MSGISTNYSASSALQALKTSLNERIKNAFQAQQDAQRAKEAEFAAAQLSPASRNAETKAAAAQRVQQIKDQIRMLTMMGGVGDPKANARQIAQLAKELAAAVREYASAGGSAADATQSAPASISAAAPAATAAAPATGTATTAAATPASTETAATDADSAQDAGKSGLQGLAQGTNPASAADQAFIREVRDLAEKLKALARQQQARMRQGDPNGDLSATREAIDEIGKGLSDIATQTTHPSVNIFA